MARLSATNGALVDEKFEEVDMAGLFGKENFTANKRLDEVASTVI